ncbi:putative para-hydroxybenzoate-polyprenyltransferase Coq2 [Talaromyces proteolyticus]|uniref:4-hydroxybenzoate polyprenyltransferase, mitochondrial n=1 Tax=Talaromyces proteolyticus TaxID=1131652 RepID=A0AAD4KKJ8_9EURO|nr:putative para-hydroxybenzoate-polyprenyltransferase Coq2 [Talaromyces proteolyticus]KAH8693118.1 putative para-hydroxybenzoate-polyprenyltransferase Coq2 [Talaromyces proteolyticus]
MRLRTSFTAAVTSRCFTSQQYSRAGPSALQFGKQYKIATRQTWSIRSFQSQLAATQQAPTVSPATYSPPQKGLLSRLPKSWVPYAELIRLDKPTGTYYLFFPCLFSSLMAAPIATPMASPYELLATTGLFFSGALIMRGAGCAINDLWDRNLDPHVERTRFRPIARKALTPQKAVIFTGFQLLGGLGILLQFPMECLWYGIPSLLFVSSYPLAKRVTHYPQFVLGLTFSWGAIMGFPALGVDLLSQPVALATAAALYSSCVAWTVLYDMIYAHMDIKDDVAAGIKSIALRHEHNTKAVLSGLAVTQVSLLALAGLTAGAGPIFFIGSCGSAILTLGTMIWRVRLKDVRNCWWWFKHGCWITGGGISLGMAGDYLDRDYHPPFFSFVCSLVIQSSRGIARSVSKGRVVPGPWSFLSSPSALQARLLSSETKAAIDKAVASAPVVLFMKGTPETPQCGFSRASIQILGLQGVDPQKFTAFNVLEDPELRQGIKEYSDWPTIPQLYVEREFVGGCDILMSMHQNGELAKLLEEKHVLVPTDE